MQKLTRRVKKNKKNTSIKSRIGSLKKGGNNVKNDDLPKKERQGIIDIIGNKIGDAASSAATYVGDAGLKIVGLERIDKSEEEKEDKKDEENKEKDEENKEKNGDSISDVGNVVEKTSDATSGIVSDVENVAETTGDVASEVIDKTGAAIIENVNEVLGSDAVKETTEQAAEKTADLIKDSAETFNEALNDPEVKAEVEEAVENAAEVGAVVVKAAEKPLNQAIDVAAEAIPKASGAAVAGVIRVGTDAMAAVPYVGSIIEFGKMLNDGSKAASSIVEAGSEAVEAGSDIFIEAKENVEEGLKELEEKKKMGEEISNRTNKSINDFENPTTTGQTGGGRKTRRRIFKRKAKSKRVRFVI